MTRGRRKDLSIPPSRALLQQRDYRARKAQYVADLEDRARKAEEENLKLKREIDSLRMRATTSGTMGPSPEVVNASSELMHQLTAAASCLARFQQLTFNEQAQAHAIQQAQMQTQNLQPPPQPSQLTMNEPSTRPTLPSVHEAIGMQISQGTSYPPSTASHSSHSQSRQASPPRAVLHPSRHTTQSQSQTQPQHAQSQPPHHHSHSHHQQHHTHSLSPNLPPVHPRDFHSHSHTQHHHQGPLRMSPPETPRQTSINGTGPPSSSSSSAAASPATTRILPPPAPSSSTSTANVNVSVGVSLAGPSRGRSNSYSVYNEVETAWGYFDSRDLGLSGGERDEEQDDDDEDQLFAEDQGLQSDSSALRGPGSSGGSGSNGSGNGGGGVGPHRRSPQGIGRGGLPSPREMLIGAGSGSRSARRRTSDMRSTTSRSSSEEMDEPMRMREDSPMRLR